MRSSCRVGLVTQVPLFPIQSRIPTRKHIYVHTIPIYKLSAPSPLLLFADMAGNRQRGAPLDDVDFWDTQNLHRSPYKTMVDSRSRCDSFRWTEAQIHQRHAYTRHLMPPDEDDLAIRKVRSFFCRAMTVTMHFALPPRH